MVSVWLCAGVAGADIVVGNWLGAATLAVLGVIVLGLIHISTKPA